MYEPLNMHEAAPLNCRLMSLLVEWHSKTTTHAASLMCPRTPPLLHHFVVCHVRCYGSLVARHKVLKYIAPGVLANRIAETLQRQVELL